MDCRRRVLSASSGAMRLWGESMSSQASMVDGDRCGETQRAASGIDAWTKPLQPASRQCVPAVAGRGRRWSAEIGTCVKFGNWSGDGEGKRSKGAHVTAS